HWNPVQHGLQSKFSADPSRLTLDQLALTIGSSHLSVQARLKDYTNPAVDGTYQATIFTPDVGNVFRTASIPTGNIMTEGSLRYQNVPNHPLLDGISVAGHLKSTGLAVHFSQAHFEIRALRGEYWIDKGDLRTRGLEAELLGGRAAANFGAQHLGANPDFNFVGVFQNISLSAVNSELGTSVSERVPIAGKLNGKLTAAWRGSLQGVRARF